MRRGVYYLAVVFLVAAPFSAIAGPPEGASPPAAVQRGDELFREARRAMRRNDHRKALKLLWRSHDLDPGVGKLANIAICEEKLGKVATALEHFRQVAEQLPPGDDRRPAVNDYLARLPARIPYLRIDLAKGVPAGTRVHLDDGIVSPPALGTEAPIDPGDHVIVASAPGRSDRRYEVTAREGKRESLTVSPGPAVAPAVVTLEPTGAPPPVGEKPSVVPVVLLGTAAGVGVVAGGVLMGISVAKGDEAARRLYVVKGEPRPCTRPACIEVDGLLAERDALGAAAVGVWIGAGVAGVVAATVAIVQGRRRSATAVIWAPAVSPTAAGFVVSGSF